jgi:hypothetical protein
MYFLSRFHALVIAVYIDFFLLTYFDRAKSISLSQVAQCGSRCIPSMEAQSLMILWALLFSILVFLFLMPVVLLLNFVIANSTAAFFARQSDRDRHSTDKMGLATARLSRNSWTVRDIIFAILFLMICALLLSWQGGASYSSSNGIDIIVNSQFTKRGQQIMCIYFVINVISMFIFLALSYLFDKIARTRSA